LLGEVEPPVGIRLPSESREVVGLIITLPDAVLRAELQELAVSS
jgi:hypothetical protein